jgi:hypothetical protein
MFIAVLPCTHFQLTLGSHVTFLTFA